MTATTERLDASAARSSAGGIAPSGAKKAAFRPDIQGLRAIAVVSVLLNHLFGWPVGGFVGVDVFFVLSGFLITGLLYREHERSGRISFAGFYRRRARRILPISTAVLAATVAASYIIFLGARAGAVATDAIWSLLFAANWHFAIVGTNYWADDGTTSPLQHYWSLAVEEQFYVVWPWIIVIVLGWAGYRQWKARSGRTAVVAVMAMLVALSFAWALFQTLTSPGFAYFSTFVRAWELGVGALLAVLAPAFSRLPAAARPVLAWVGLFGIVASLFMIDGSAGFPAPIAALPVLSTALVVAAGTGGAARFLFPLTNRVSGYLGDISYSLYLWHFPVVILLAAILPRGATYFAVALLLMGGLSVLSYHFLEEPIRRSRWLEPKPRTEGRPTSWVANRLLTFGRGDVVIIVAAVLAGTIVIIGGVALRGPAAPEVTTPVARTTAAPTGSGDGALAAEINAALAASSFPELNPAVDTLGAAAWVKQVNVGGCADIGPANVTKCQVGPAGSGKSVAVLGDSFAIAWTPGIVDAFSAAGYRVHPYTMGQCPAASVTVTKNKGEAFPECDQHRDWAIAEIVKSKPDIVILADAMTTLDRLTGKPDTAAGSAEIAGGMKTTIERLAGVGKIVVLSDPPLGVSLQECVTRFSAPDDCATSISDDWLGLRKVVKPASEGAGAAYVDTHRWFCNADEDCPGFVGTTPIRADGAHLTPQFSRMLAPELAKAIIG